MDLKAKEMIRAVMDVYEFSKADKDAIERAMDDRELPRLMTMNQVVEVLTCYSGIDSLRQAIKQGNIELDVRKVGGRVMITEQSVLKAAGE